jgi:phosphopantothenoylcysteine decarboxylase/phosphopantothenate--cysteine ligase
VSTLAGRRVVLGVTGSIAAYKAAQIASLLTQTGAGVDVILTPAAAEFVTPLTFRSLTLRPVFTDMFDAGSIIAEQHVAVARAAEAVVIAPASADVMARLAHGLADDLLTLTVLATTAPVLLAPAMDSQMWQHPATQRNVQLLRDRGVAFVGPDSGRLASGHSGPGRLVAPVRVVEALKVLLGRSGDLAGKSIVVSAGGTQEPIDPVRYVGNLSSGKMGYAIAEAARDRGATVTLVAGPGALPEPYGVTVVPVRRASEMLDAVRSACKTADALVMAAAVADFQPAVEAGQKIKKQEGVDELALTLVRTPDILAELKSEASLVKIGFAAETEDLLRNARDKLERKGLDLIAANDVTASDAGFSVDTNRLTLIGRTGEPEALPLLSKYDAANAVLDRLVPMLREQAKRRS